MLGRSSRKHLQYLLLGLSCLACLASHLESAYFQTNGNTNSNVLPTSARAHDASLSGSRIQTFTTGQTGMPFMDASLVMPDSIGAIAAVSQEEGCKAHCDCPQGSFCYYGKCMTDPGTPVYCCSDAAGLPKEGCQPGRWCFEPNGSKSACAESETHVCQTACDCGPAHACKEIPGKEGKRCVKDTADPWYPGGGNIFADRDVKVVQGEDATYCCEDALCHAAMQAYGSSELFRCASKVDGSVHDICGGKSCGSSCDCDPGMSCIDIKGAPRPPFGKVCDTSFSLNPATPSALCVSSAVAEAAYGVSPAELIPCCGKGCFPGQKCEVGWVQGGGYLLERVVGVCGGSCGNGTWDPGESAITCPSDCPQPPRYPDCGVMSNEYSFYFAMCGDGTCDKKGYTPENCMTCPQDCGPQVHSDSDYLADCVDNCPAVANPDQGDADGDGFGDACDPDRDGDGIENAADACPATPLGSGVRWDGCSIAELCPCTATWANHGVYVACVARVSESFLAAGLISVSQKGEEVNRAAKSACGSRR